MSDILEQVITSWNRHIYMSKSSAMRAARTMAARSVTSRSWGFGCWDDAEIRRGFQGYIRFTPDMIVIEPQAGGWRWGVACKRGDVLVWVRLPNKRMAQLPYREAIKGWHDSETPIAH